MSRRYRKVLSAVWCDVHCSVHDSTPDVYDEGMTDCRRGNWQSLFILTADKESY